MDAKTKSSIQEIKESLLVHAEETLKKEIEKHKDGDVAKAIQDISDFANYLRDEEEKKGNESCSKH